MGKSLQTQLCEKWLKDLVYLPYTKTTKGRHETGIYVPVSGRLSQEQLDIFFIAQRAKSVKITKKDVQTRNQETLLVCMSCQPVQ